MANLRKQNEMLVKRLEALESARIVPTPLAAPKPHRSKAQIEQMAKMRAAKAAKAKGTFLERQMALPVLPFAPRAAEEESCVPRSECPHHLCHGEDHKDGPSECASHYCA
jgi:hypothetical protein